MLLSLALALRVKSLLTSLPGACWGITTDTVTVNAFSRCSTPPPDLYIDLDGMSTSHRCCKTFTGCSLRNASISSWLCSFTDACTVWRHGTFPTTSRASPTPTAAVFGRRHPRSWWFDVHGCPPSAIEHFRWLAAAYGTVCRLMLPQLQRWLFFGIASKLSFSPNHFLPNCFPFLSVRRVL